MTDLSDIARKSLGDSTSYAVYTETVDPTLLNPMPRNLARETWNITGDEFVGIDVWHAYEATFMNSNHRPISGILKIVYDAKSEYMIESKSLKLYLNTYDMTVIDGNDIDETAKNYSSMIASDLSKVLKTEVRAHFFNSIKLSSYRIDPIDTMKSYDLERDYFVKSCKPEDFHAEKNHLTINEMLFNSVIHTNSLRSRCRHTKQKDSGIAIMQQSNENGGLIDFESFYKQIVSLREVNEFHEFCAEKIFCDVMKVNPESKTLIAFLYARRGGIDINPIRASRRDMIPDYFYDEKILTSTKISG